MRTVREQNGDPQWLRANEKGTPLWLRTIYASLPVTAVFVVYGGVHDLHPVQVDGSLRPDTTINAIWQVLKDCGFQALLSFDPYNGLSINCTSEDWGESKLREILKNQTANRLVGNLLQTPAERAVQASKNSEAYNVGFTGLDAIVEAVATTNNPAMALIIDYTSQVSKLALERLKLTSLMLANAHALFNRRPVRFIHSEQNRHMRHPIIWVVDSLEDLPIWLTHGDSIRAIPIAQPDIDTRVRVAELLVSDQVPSSEVEQVARRFADATEGFTMRGMFESVQLARGSDSVTTNIEAAVRTYREGLSENPWQSTRLRERLSIGESVIKRRVLGQDEAVEKVLDILKRSALGLTGAHQKKASTMPRGVLYFAGPSGVGKTEMAKAIAELVFADDQSLLRFDMSEFRDDHAKMRLIGAPPSYVGYDEGGELTNAIMQRPHSIVLFDEMDKAGPQVYDLFLQILSDGRLTSGTGRTVSFSETLIIFTSNQGVADIENLFQLDMDAPEQAEHYEASIREAVESHFRKELKRPELLGRLGDNIVVFRPMHGQVARDLANQFIDTILANVRIRIGNLVEIDSTTRRQLIDFAITPEVLASGGRGITTALEDKLVNPLGRALFRLQPDALLRVTGVGVGATGQPTLSFEIG